MLEMWQALATGLGTNMSSHSEQGKAIAADKVIDMPVMGIWFNASPNAKQYCTLGGEDFVLEGDEVESDYVFLCGVMWCGYGQEEVGRELLRATLSRDPDISTLAWCYVCERKDCS
jgi:hypothetical protein